MIDYYLLMKPGIILGNLVPFVAAFLLASERHFDLHLFIVTLIALSFIMASGCICNNYIDRHLDREMQRTKNRPLVTGVISVKQALLLSSILFFSGNILLYIYVNQLTLLLGDIGFFVYVVLYSTLKSKTVYSTLIGSVAGAIPPLVGYCAVSNHFDVAAALLFSIMVLWQMPHFFAIALWHLEDYTKANIPVLPISKGAFRAKIHITIYILCLLPTVSLLHYFGYASLFFLVVTTSVGLLWFAFSLRGFFSECDTHFGQQMFRFSLVMINTICFTLLLDILR